MSVIKYQIVSLGGDYPGKISNFAEARNYFLARHEWVLFIDDDEEACNMLIRHLDRLQPRYPYYWIRRLNLIRGKYIPLQNPDYSPRLVSNKVRFVGRIHEKIVPKDPHGTIDYPIIHDQAPGPSGYRNYWYQDLPVYRVWLGVKKMMEVVRER